MTESENLSHFDDSGQVNMVDITEKKKRDRVAVAHAEVVFPGGVLACLLDSGLEKGELFSTARLAGIQGAKQTSRLIPLAHPISLTHVSVELNPRPEEDLLTLETRARARDATGVEMEALTAAVVAGLAVYDMCKGVAKGIELQNIYLVEKKGGTSGRWVKNHESE